MNEEEIIKYIKDEIENEIDTYHWFDDMPGNKTRKQIEESINAHQGLLDLYQKEKEKIKELEEINKNLLDNLNHSIRSSAIRERLGIEENISEEQMLDYIDIIVAENARLEDIEDKKVQIEYEKVFNKGVNSVKDKIKEKIEELCNKYQKVARVEDTISVSMYNSSIDYKIQVLQELLEEE